MIFGKKKKHFPISELKPEKIVLLWCDSYDCGWCCDIGWKHKDGTIFVNTMQGAFEADMPYSLYSEIERPE